MWSLGWLRCFSAAAAVRRGCRDVLVLTVFWLKMGLMVLLLLNGALLLRGERQVTAGRARAWARLHYAAVASLVLWFLTTLAGAALPNIG